MKLDADTKKLLETFMITMDDLVEKAENMTSGERDLNKSLGEIHINDTKYQINISLVSNKDKWLQDGELMFSPNHKQKK